MDTRDQVASSTIRVWLESRESDRTAWKKVSVLASLYGIKRLTPASRQRIADSLFEAGVRLLTPFESLGMADTVHLQLSGFDGDRSPEPTEDTDYSDTLPNQIIAWDAMNFGEGPEDTSGQWLRCLKSTSAGERQFVWEASSNRGIVGLVTFSGQVRNAGVYEGWGIHHAFCMPVSREDLQSHPATSWRFSNNGIRALQGSAIRLTQEEAEAICELAGGLESTLIPWSEPDESAPVIQWTRVNGLPAEVFIENAIRDTPTLWRKLKLSQQPEQQVHYKDIGRVDLVAGNTIIEAKKAVTVDNGPAQIERYLRHLTNSLRTTSRRVRGILVQNNPWALPGVKDRLLQSPFPLELWAVYWDEQGKWKAIQIV